MTRLCVVSLLTTVVILTSATSARTQASQPALVALVSDIHGVVTVRQETAASGELRLYSGLKPESVISVSKDARVTLVMTNGRRFAANGETTLRVDPDVITATRGTVREIERLPRLPDVRAIASGDHPKGPAASVRVRGVAVEDMYPAGGASALAGETALSFAAVPGASRYRLRVDNTEGRAIFRTETTSTTITVPPGTLQPGVTYYWYVETVDRFGGAAKGLAEFSTVERDSEEARRLLRLNISGKPDARTLGLLADIDWRVGLWREAVEGFRQAVRLAPEDAALREALADAQRQLASAR